MKNRSSGTAEGVAYLRYYESLRQLDQRICNDYMAFGLSAWWVKLTAAICKPVPHRLMDKALENKGKGVSSFLAVRTRIFDDFVLDGVKNGAKQYVILGAGLDSRAYRFSDELRDTKVFEVDHPLSQAVKIQRVQRLIDEIPENVRYVPVDFTKDSLLNCLLNARYDPSARTIFTFEGVTMYLDEKSVKETMEFVLNHSGKGSSIMFDYVYAGAIDGRIKNKIVSHMNNLKYIFNEPILFGIETGEVEKFIRSIGFENVKDYPPELLYEMYIQRCDPKRPISDLYAIAAAYK